MPARSVAVVAVHARKDHQRENDRCEHPAPATMLFACHRARLWRTARLHRPAPPLLAWPVAPPSRANGLPRSLLRHGPSTFGRDQSRLHTQPVCCELLSHLPAFDGRSAGFGERHHFARSMRSRSALLPSRRAKHSPSSPGLGPPQDRERGRPGIRRVARQDSAEEYRPREYISSRINILPFPTCLLRWHVLRCPHHLPELCFRGVRLRCLIRASGSRLTGCVFAESCMPLSSCFFCLSPAPGPPISRCPSP